jgi:hypothetical protein
MVADSRLTAARRTKHERRDELPVFPHTPSMQSLSSTRDTQSRLAGRRRRGVPLENPASLPPAQSGRRFNNDLPAPSHSDSPHINSGDCTASAVLLSFTFNLPNVIQTKLRDNHPEAAPPRHATYLGSCNYRTGTVGYRSRSTPIAGHDQRAYRRA